MGCIAALDVAVTADVVAEAAEAAEAAEPEVAVEADLVVPLAVVVPLVITAVDMVDPLPEAVTVAVTERSEAMMALAWCSIER